MKKEIKQNLENLKSIETENVNTKKKLQDLEDRSRYDNLGFDSIIKY